MTSQRAKRAHPTIEVIEDRYDGLIGNPGNIDKRLGLALLDVLGRLVNRTARIPAYEDHEGASWLVDDLLKSVKASIVQGVHERGIAR